MNDAQQGVPHRLEFDLREYWSVVWRWKWLALGVFLLVFFSVAWHVHSQNPLYESSVTIQLSARQPMASLEGTRISWYGPSRKLDTQIKIITENDELHQKAREALLEALPAGSPSRATVERARDFYRGKIQAEQLDQSDIIQITVRALDPDLAQQAAQTLADTYIQWFIEEATQEVENTRDFVKERLAEQEQALRKVEEQASTFEREHPGVGTASLYRDRLAALQVTLAEMLERYTERHPQVIKLREEMTKLEASLEKLPEVDLEYNRLLARRDQLRTLVGSIHEQFLQMDIAYKRKLEESLQEVAVIRKASQPVPQGASPWVTTMLGAIVGLIVGLGATLAAHALDTSLATVEGVEELTGLPVLGEIPYLGVHGRGRRGRLLSALWRRTPVPQRDRLLIKLPLESQAADAYKTVRKQLLDQLPERDDGSGHIVLITSAAPREGKTITTLNLAFTMGQSGRRVLYLEADLRRPAAAWLLGVRGRRAAGGRHIRAKGLTDLLVGAAGLRESTAGLPDLLMGELGWDGLVSVPGIDNVEFIFSGTHVRNPAEVLATEELGRLLAELRRNYDMVLVDCSPAFPVPDPAIIGPLTDGVCLVYNIGITSRQILLRAKQLLAGFPREGEARHYRGDGEAESPRPHSRLLGVVLNQIRPDVQLKDYYRYRYRYYGEA